MLIAAYSVVSAVVATLFTFEGLADSDFIHDHTRTRRYVVNWLTLWLVWPLVLAMHVALAIAGRAGEPSPPRTTGGACDS